MLRGLLLPPGADLHGALPAGQLLPPVSCLTAAKVARVPHTDVHSCPPCSCALLPLARSCSHPPVSSPPFALQTALLHRCRGRSARAAAPPERYRHGDAQWCAPYAYKGRQDLGCGGADKWRIVPGSAFPLERWEEGSGSIYWWGCCGGGLLLLLGAGGAGVQDPRVEQGTGSAWQRRPPDAWRQGRAVRVHSVPPGPTFCAPLSLCAPRAAATAGASAPTQPQCKAARLASFAARGPPSRRAARQAWPALLARRSQTRTTQVGWAWG